MALLFTKLTTEPLTAISNIYARSTLASLIYYRVRYIVMMSTRELLDKSTRAAENES